jgi:flagellar FliL protein
VSSQNPNQINESVNGLDKKQSSNKPVMILLIITIAIVVLMLSFFVFMYINGDKNKAQSAPAAAANTVNVRAAADEKTVDLDEFVINLSDTDKRAYAKIKVSIAFDSKEKKLEKEITAKIPQIRQIINLTIMNKKSEEINNAQNLSKIVSELITKINDIMTTGRITNVYIRDILISY